MTTTDPSRAARPTPHCQICGRQGRLRRAATIRPSVVEEIRRDFPQWSDHGYVCQDDLARFRARHVEHLLEGERGELSELERQVVDSLARHEILAQNVEEEFDEQLTTGQRLADRIAEFGGSWTFLLSFAAFLMLWVLLNTYIIFFGRFDPYPFILLNLVLSCLAAIQAPVIMMSQNRLEAKDRKRSEHDYRVNLKAELEIRHLHEKIDHLLSHQWERLIEVQQIQLELLDELTKPGRRPGPPQQRAPKNTDKGSETS